MASNGEPRVMCLGDVMLARGVSEYLQRAEPASLWGDCLPLLAEAELRLANLECCISDRGRPFEPPRVFSFRAIPKAIEVLRAANIEVVTLANNHSLDWGPEALLDTLRRLDRAGIAHVGAGKNLEEARRPVLLEVAGKKVGIVGFTDNFPEYGAGASTPGTFYVDVRNGAGEVVQQLSRAREMGADRVVVTAHWGPNMRERPPQHFRDFARSVMDAGSDLFFGHSAHIFQGVEFYRGRPIIYDGGDFLDDYAVDEVLRNDLSLAWRVTLGDPAEVEGFPVKLEYGRTERAQGEDLQWIHSRLRELCAEWGVRVLPRNGSLQITP